MQVDNKTDGAYAVLQLRASCSSATAALDLKYHFLFDSDPTHRGLISFKQAGNTYSLIASPDTRYIRFDAESSTTVTVLMDYLTEGIWHIWIGFDHILFLLTLLLPAVLVFRHREWQAVEPVRPALLDVIKIVTAFTLAHSITLALAVFEVVTLPSRLVESVIALSVLVTALNNLRPIFSASRWLFAFVFGLIHGFGFAGVLVDLGLPDNALTVALLGFNIGVELGQLAIVALVFPLAVFIRHTRFYRNWVLTGGSAAASLLATVWLVVFLLRAPTARDQAFFPPTKLWPVYRLQRIQRLIPSSGRNAYGG